MTTRRRFTGEFKARVRDSQRPAVLCIAGQAAGGLLTARCSPRATVERSSNATQSKTSGAPGGHFA
jgi:hypothetical protein